MKKVTRPSLNEGTKVMPPPTEDEQRACVGGPFYYADDGTYLGALGVWTLAVIRHTPVRPLHWVNGTPLAECK